MRGHWFKPHGKEQKFLIERAQKIFLLYLHFRDFTYVDRSISYRELTGNNEITTIADRKMILSMKFLYKLIYG